jgi:low temperature requirement protein LtrA
MRDANLQGMLLTIIMFVGVVLNIAQELASNEFEAMSTYNNVFSFVACLATARLFWLFWKDCGERIKQ